MPSYYLADRSGDDVLEFLGVEKYPAKGTATSGNKEYEIAVVSVDGREKTYIKSPESATSPLTLSRGSKSIELTISATNEKAFNDAKKDATSAPKAEKPAEAADEPAAAASTGAGASKATKKGEASEPATEYSKADSPDLLKNLADATEVNSAGQYAFTGQNGKKYVLKVNANGTKALYAKRPEGTLSTGFLLSLNSNYAKTYNLGGDLGFSTARAAGVPKEVRALFGDNRDLSDPSKPEGRGSGERGSGRDDAGERRERESSATGPATPSLGEFLYKHATFAFEGIPVGVNKGRNTGADKLADNVRSDSYAWGPAQRLATVGFASACKGKTFYVYLEESKTAIGDGLDKIISAYKGDTDEPTDWGGATVGGQKFAPSDDGLRDFLRLAYVSTRAGGEPSGFVAAEKMDVKPIYADFLPTDPLWKRMCLVGCISPATLIKLISPVPLGQGEAATLVISSAGSAIGNVNITSAKGTGTFLVPMGLDATPGNITDTASTTPQLVKGAAKSIAGAIVGGQSLTFELTNGRGTFGSAAATLTEMGTTVTLAGGSIPSQASPAAGATSPGATSAPSPLAGSGAGNYRFARRAGRGRTGEEPFTFLNYIRNNSGAIEQNPLKAKLVKRISGGNDVFTLIAGDTDPGYILIPIPSPGLPATGEVDVSSAATWALAAAGAPAVGAVGTSYLPVKSIEWIFDGMNQSFGPEILPDIIAIDVEPADVNAAELARVRGINVYTKRRGDENLIRKAWAQYLGTTNNVVGTRIYTTRGFAEAINAFQAETRRSF